MRTFKKGGVHPPQCKFTADKGIRPLFPVSRVTLLMRQHLGAPAVPSVKVGQMVCRGDVVGESAWQASVPVHTPISGVVKFVGRVTAYDGSVCDAVVVEASADTADMQIGESWNSDPEREIDIASLTPESIREELRRAGVVGLGGATFPTHVKLTPPAGMTVDTLVVNGAECEPYLTCDDALMRERKDAIICGIRIAVHACGASRALIGIECNKPLAIEALESASAPYDNISVCPLTVKYPQGGEKQLIEALTGRRVQSGGLPASVGVVVVNVATCAAIYDAVALHKPLMERVVTVSGVDLNGGGNYLVPLGTPLSEIANIAGGIPEGTGKIIAGGPMMGRAVINIEAPLAKGISGLVFIPAKDSERRPVQPCVRCARCVEVCPMGLEPYLISTQARLSDVEGATASGLLDCIECGSCSYICPSSRPLVDYIRAGKSLIRKRKK
ncbi:MAG: electron transport complex subunit RsxC [Muribaculaceae bacterium]|nr:electron transport complex subunit RsxC [Muribaculaceae bacterium]